MTAGVRLFLFGSFRLENADGEVLSISLRKAEALLAYLAVAPGKTASREKLATLLWGESDQQRARQSLRQALFALTREFAQAEVIVLRMESQMVSLDPAAIWVDVGEFESLVGSEDTARLAKATAYYTGSFLQDFTVDSPDFDDWLMTTQRRMEESALKAFIELLDRQERAGEIAAAIETAQGALRIDNFREDIHRRLIQLYMSSGMRSSALHQYRLCHDFLARELGVTPDDETNALYRKILDAGPAAAPELEPLSQSAATVAVPMLGRDGAGAARVRTVGRVAEARDLDRFMQQAREGRCAMIAATGEAGVGKSRLLDDFVGILAGQGVAGLLVRGRRTEHTLALGLLADLLDRDALAADSRLDAGLSAAAQDELARFRAGRSRAPGGGKSNPATRPLLFDAAVELIRARSAHQPLALVFDDLQWADPDSIRMIAYAVRHLAGAPVLFVASVPSEEFGRGLLSDLLRDLERDGLLSLITLQPLSREETGELVHRLQEAAADKPNPKLKSNDIWALSEGNPQIVSEILALNTEPEGTARSEGLRLPNRVFTEVARAMAPLGESARELANFACVIGPRADFKVLCRCAGFDTEAVVRGVEELVAAGVLRSDGDDLGFSRERIRLALYESLIPLRRRSLHATVARAIEEIHAGALELFFGVLAHHHHKAGDAARGLECELAHANIELKRGARASARKLFQKALKSVLAARKDERTWAQEVEARIGLGTIAETERNLETAAAIFGNLENQIQRIEEPQLRTTALLALSRIDFMGQDEDSAYEHARRALAEAGRAGGDFLWPPAERLLIRIHLIAAAVGETIERLGKLHDRARRLRLHEDEAEAESAIGILHAIQGDFTGAEDHCGRAVVLAERLGSERGLAAALQFRGMVGMWRGGLDEALADFDKARESALERGDLLRLYSLIGHRGFALAAARRYEEAMAEFRSALDMAVRLNTRTFQALFMAWLAEASFEAGDHEEALHAGREAGRLAAEQNQPWARSVALRALARVLAHSEVRDLAGAEKSIRTALADQESLGIKFETARSMIVQAKIMRSAGDTRRSSAVYDQASKMFQQMQMTGDFDSARHMAEALRPGGD